MERNHVEREREPWRWGVKQTSTPPSREPSVAVAAAHQPNVDADEEDDENACYSSDGPDIHLSLTVVKVKRKGVSPDEPLLNPRRSYCYHCPLTVAPHIHPRRVCLDCSV